MKDERSPMYADAARPTGEMTHCRVCQAKRSPSSGKRPSDGRSEPPSVPFNADFDAFIRSILFPPDAAMLDVASTRHAR